MQQQIYLFLKDADLVVFFLQLSVFITKGMKLLNEKTLEGFGIIRQGGEIIQRHVHMLTQSMLSDDINKGIDVRLWSCIQAFREA